MFLRQQCLRRSRLGYWAWRCLDCSQHGHQLWQQQASPAWQQSIHALPRSLQQSTQSQPIVRGFASAAAQSAGKGAGRKSPITFNGMLLGVGAFLAVVAVAQNKAQQKVEGMMQRSQEVVGKAAVGGPFSLVDQDGKTFTHENLLGKFSVLYFGFTHCPDICPDELEKLAAAVDLLEQKQQHHIQPVFISVDPKRDTPKAVKAYIKEFHPRLIGLTGSEEAVKACSKAYRVYFHKSGDSDTDYLIDHSIIMYLIDPAGEFVTFYGKNFTAEQLADSIGQHICKWQQQAAGDAAAADERLKTGTAGSQEGLAQR
eukprot:GHRR01005089.1.p1 GENE.GHRR01005089.1~~GHRR01005089.1.p1  ORF type:complete len:313 (+),score=96.78 GHRR01005089.1:264-1202(+)